MVADEEIDHPTREALGAAYAAAVRLIRGAVESRATRLNLGPSGLLREFPQELEQLAGTLKHFILAREEDPYSDWPECCLRTLKGIDCLKRLEILDLSHCVNLRDLNGIGALTSLRMLSLMRCESLLDLRPLKTLSSLRELDLSGVGNVSSLEGVKELTALEKLSVSDRQVTDLHELSSLKHLRELNLAECRGLSSLAGIEQFEGLRKVRMQKCDEITDLSPLTRLPHLEELILMGCRSIESLRPLASMGTLRELEVWRYPHDDLLPISGFTGLRRLHVSGERNTTLKGLPALENLTRLSLYFGKLSQLHEVGQLTNLEEFEITECQAEHLDALAGLTKLRSVKLYNCRRLTDLSGLKPSCGLRSLTTQHLDGVQEFGFLEALPEIEELDLGCERFTDLSFLRTLRNLKSLRCYACIRLRSLEGIEDLNQLTNLDLNECEKLTDISALSGLSELRELRLLSVGGISDFQPLLSLSKLELLDLREIKLPHETLRTLATGLPNLKEFCCTVDGLPREYQHTAGLSVLDKLRIVGQMSRRQQLAVNWQGDNRLEITDYTFRTWVDKYQDHPRALEIGCGALFLVAVAFLWQGWLIGFLCLMIWAGIIKLLDLYEKNYDELLIKGGKVLVRRVKCGCTVRRRSYPATSWRGIKSRPTGYLELCESNHLLTLQFDEEVNFNTEFDRSEIEDIKWLIRDTIEIQSRMA